MSYGTSASRMTTMPSMDDAALDDYARSRYANTPQDIATEDRAAKRVHRANGDAPPTSSFQQRNDVNRRQSLVNRRTSGMRDYKPPLGPRPPDFNSSRRYVSPDESIGGRSDRVRVMSDAPRPQQPPANRPFPPNPNSEPFLGLSSRRMEPHYEPSNATSSSSRAQDRPRTTGQDMLSSSNHLTTSQEPRLTRNQLQVENERPLGFAVGSDHGKQGSLDQLNRNSPKPLTGTSSPTRRGGAALKAAQLSTASAAQSSSAAPPSLRSRRQSQFPAPPPREPAPRQPRQSVGPGVLTNDARFALESSSTRGAPDLPAVCDSTPLKRQLSNSKARSRVSMAPASTSVLGRQYSGDNHDSISANNGHYLADYQKERQISQPWTGRTVSRTVSPTDIKKAKRASGISALPQRPVRSPTPESPVLSKSYRPMPPPSTKERSPPSSRTTPDLNPRFSTGRSLSSRSSYTSLRPPSASMRQSPGPGWQSTRTLSNKPKNNDTSTQAGPEIVPPVPAIPKAFGSSGSTNDEPYYDSFEAQPVASGALSSDVRKAKTRSMAVPPAAAPKRDPSPDAKFRRRFTLGPRAAHERSERTLQSNRQSSQPFRLPPLNVLPLSEQTSERIDSMARQQADQSTGAQTPLFDERQRRPPSTPMTASKATFSNFDFHRDRSKPPVPGLQSSNFQGRQSQAAAIFDRSTNRSPARPNTPPARQQGGSNGQDAISATVDTKQSPRKITRARGQKSDPAKDQNATASYSWRGKSRASSRNARKGSTTTDPEDPPKAPTPSSKHRMSLRFRRAASRTPNGGPALNDSTSNSVTDAINMPPPKIPASKLWTEPMSLSSSIASHQSDVETKTNNDADVPGQTASRAKRGEASGARNAISSQATKAANLITSHRSTSSRSLGPSQKEQQANGPPEQEIVVADEEMRRLASKRKEFEANARELDSLLKRAAPKDGLTRGQVRKSPRLNNYEIGELSEHPAFYFLGSPNARKIPGDAAAAKPLNFGFDDERGDYHIVEGDHLQFRYEIVDVLGKGSFGQVARCIDHKTGRLVAIKIIRNKSRFHQQALVETNILRKLQEWDPHDQHSMVNIADHFVFRNHLCIVTELLGINLYEFTKAHDFRGFPLKLIKRFTRQMLGCLCVLQDHKVIHCDLKPENVLLAHPLRSAIKTIDFGSSCFENEKVYTYIQSRFYRSPEVILGMEYGMPIDMWSMGCILAELYTGYPIFPGENEQEQLACIMEVFGPPEKHLIERSSRKKVFFDSLGKPRATVSSKGKRRRPSSKTLQQAIKCDDEAFLDFLTKCLRWDPERRLKPDEAMSHEFLTGPKNRSRVNLTSSPMKKPLSFSRTPSRTRPLPEPPASTSTIKPVNGTMTAPSSSPLKPSLAGRRQSTMNATTTTTNRNTSGPATGSALPRSISGKPDFASAAAISSLRNR